MELNEYKPQDQYKPQDLLDRALFETYVIIKGCKEMGTEVPDVDFIKITIAFSMIDPPSAQEFALFREKVVEKINRDQEFAKMYKATLMIINKEDANKVTEALIKLAERMLQ